MRNLIRVIAVAVLSASMLVPTMSSATPEGDDLVIKEVYVNGGSSGATYLNKFVELYNPTDEPISVAGWSLQYRAPAGTGNFSGLSPLTAATIPPGGSYLIRGGSNAANGQEVPAPDASTGVQWGAGGGTLALVSNDVRLTGSPEDILANPAVVDLIGWGTSITYEGSGTATGNSVTLSLNRDSSGTDTDNNAADFTAAAPTPCGVASPCSADPDPEPTEPEPTPTEPEPTPEPEVVTIAEIQGTGDESPLVGQTVTTRGLVTAAYPTGGFNGAYIQTPGTGGAIDLAEHTASHGLSIFSSAFANAVEIGDYVEITGPVVEFNGLTQITPSAGSWTILDDSVSAVEPALIEFPLTGSERESLEGMLVYPQGEFTITNNYSTNQWAEIGLAAGSTPLRQPTDVARPGSAEYEALVAENADRLITLDDASSLNFLSGVNRHIPVPWLRPDNEVRVGAQVDFTAPVIFDYRNNLWKLQPTRQLTATGEEPISIADSRPEQAPEVGGDIKIASFNVLNYFTTLGEDFVASGAGTCTYYTDREGNRITVNRCEPNGPRGAANQVNLQRQQDKIVAAISELGADVVSLEEIENSAAYGLDRDTALNALVAALNEHEGADNWAAVPSPAAVPADEDVIRTAFIYRPAVVNAVGSSVIHDDPAFHNAREPLSQEFGLVGGDTGDEFVVIVNHFKSKGSGEGEDADQGDGQGASNASRIRQATALVEFAQAESQRADTELVFLSGDFNAYGLEDPVQIFEAAGYTNIAATYAPDDYTYQFGGLVGSLDHIFASEAALAQVTDAAVWGINAEESVAREYSRFNNNVTPLYDTSPFRASDHNPIIVGLDRVSEQVDPRDPQLSATASSPRWPLPALIDVTSASRASGALVAYRGNTPVGVGLLVNGRAVVLTVPLLSRGEHNLQVRYLGSRNHDPQTITVPVRIR